MRKTNNGEDGFIMALVLVILTILTVFGVAMMLLSNVNLETVGNMRIDQKAINTAFSRIERGKEYIVKNSCEFNGAGGAEMLDVNGSLFAYFGDGELTAEGVICEDVATSEAGLVASIGAGSLTITAHLKSPLDPNVKEDYFLLTATGEDTGVQKLVKMRYKRKSYLDFAIFNNADLTLADNEIFKGSVYVAGNLTATGGGNEIKGDLYLGSALPAAGSATTGNDYDNLSIEGKSFLDYSRDLAPENQNVLQQIEEFYTQAVDWGWVVNPALLGQVGAFDPAKSTNRVMDLSLFKVSGTNIIYDAASSINLGAKENFIANGMVFWNEPDDLFVKGILDVPGLSLTIFARNSNIVLMEGLQSNATPTTYVGLVVSGEGKNIIFSMYSPVYIENQAALMAVRGTLARETAPGDNPADYAISFGLANPWWTPPVAATDFDRSNSTEPLDTWGWNETAIPNPERINLLVQVGPVIVRDTMDLGLWNTTVAPAGVTKSAAFLYDADIMNVPPPFPSVNSILEKISYGEEED